MTALATFPLTAEMRARLAARETAVSLSRTILRGQDRHAPDDLRLACHTLMTYGDSFDWVEAYQVLRAMDAPRVVAPAQRPGLIRGVAVGVAAALTFAWLGLSLVLSAGVGL